MSRLRMAVVMAVAIPSASCGSCEPKAARTTAPGDAAHPRQALDKPPVTPVIAVGSLPHDRTAFTQGLAFWQGRLFEGTGLYGESVIRELDPASGLELRRAAIDAKYFGEGITILNDRLYQLTWREHTCLIYDVSSFQKLGELPYEGEGWGLTSDGTSLITSDGTAWIRYRDPASFQVTRSLQVTMAGRPVDRLNELEYIHDEIWANVWYSDAILRISPTDGHVIAALDASKLLDPALGSGDPDDVLNGIAFDPGSGSLLLTGKRWPAIYKAALPR